MWTQRHLFLQLAYHLMVILKHQQHDTTTSDLLQEAMENVQYYIGSNQNFWDLPYEHYALLVPDGWMKFTWKCLLDEVHLEMPVGKSS